MVMAMKVLVREGETATILDNCPERPTESKHFNKQPGNKVEISPTGKQFAALTITTLSIYDCSTSEQVGGLPLSGCIAIKWSPSGCMMQTFERPEKDKGNAHKNLKLWDLASGELLIQLFQKNYSRDTWPSIQLPSQEDLAFHAAPNAVNVYDPRNFAKGSLRKLHLKGLGGFAVAPAGGPHLAAYVPEAKGSPGFVAIYDHTLLVKGGDAPPPICRRSFFRANQVKLTWSPVGGSLLAEASSDTSANNASYYGDTKLHFLSAEPGVPDCLVALKEGPVHCATWAPDGSRFVVVAGFMPAQIAVFDNKCKQVADLGTGSYNLAAFNRWGRFLAVAGFGNLPGDLAFYEHKGSGKWSQLATARVNNGVTMEWAPDGRHLMTATLTPRLRVDNAVSIYHHYDGLVVGFKPFKELLEAVWLPDYADQFQDKPSAPNPAAKALKDGVSTAGNDTPIKQPPKPAGGYVPPARRAAAAAAAAVSAGGQADFGAAQDRHNRVAKAGAAAAAGRTLLPGEGGASKSAAKRARKKAAAAAAGGEEVGKEAVNADIAATGTAAPSAADIEQADSRQQEGNDKHAVVEGNADDEKRLRNLQKKLRQVQLLEDKDSATLDAGQKAKLNSKQSLLAEIRSLGGAV